MLNNFLSSRFKGGSDIYGTTVFYTKLGNVGYTNVGVV
jgi:hypothetical protein